MLDQASSTELPTGETIPSPVTTTRLLDNTQLLPVTGMNSSMLKTKGRTAVQAGAAGIR
jgi:hypothetical protein